MVKFVYFDVGGVVIRDFSGTDNWQRLKEELGVSEERSKEFDDVWDIFEEEINIGRDVNSVIPELNKRLNLSIPNNLDLLDAFVSKFEKNEPMWPVISKVKKAKKVGLLTNMYPGMFEGISQKGILPPIEFDVIVDSSKVSVKKPKKEIYELAEKISGYSGDEILFIDNSLKNLELPKTLGWQVFLHDAKNQEQSSREFLKHFLNLVS